MFDTLQVHRWHRQFSAFVCRVCRRATTYVVEGPAEMKFEGSIVGRVLVRERRRRDALALRCDACEGRTLFPYVRVERFEEFVAASRKAQAFGLERLPCTTCEGYGVHAFGPRSWREGPWEDVPCDECRGAGFVWSRWTGGTEWTFDEVLADAPVARGA